MVRGAPPSLVMVTAWGALVVLVFWDGNVTLAGLEDMDDPSWPSRVRRGGRSGAGAGRGPAWGGRAGAAGGRGGGRAAGGRRGGGARPGGRGGRGRVWGCRPCPPAGGSGRLPCCQADQLSSELLAIT